MSSTTWIAVYGDSPLLAMVSVYVTVAPGVTGARGTDFVMVRCGTSTVARASQAGSVPAGGQFAPCALVTARLRMTLSPVAGSRTRTPLLTVTVPGPAGRSPVQTSWPGDELSRPELAVAVPRLEAS